MQVESMIKPVCDSFIGWLGGKTKLRPTIINSMPKHMCYVEVFGGSCTIFFGKPHQMSRVEIVNDLHKDLVNLMKVLSGTYFDESVRQEFISYVRDMPAARSAFEEWKHWDENKLSNLTPAQRAFRFYYCVKKGFSSTPKGGYEASPMTNSRYNQKTDFEKFTNRFRINNAQIECMDFNHLITKYNRKDADVFFFCDPPYWVANDTNYYDFVFTPEDHDDLKKCVDEIDKNENKFLITYDDEPEIIDRYKDYFIYRTDPIVYSSSDERGSRDLIKTEIFISNYDINAMIHKKNTLPRRGQRRGDVFSESNESDDRIDFPGAIGLKSIHRP